MQEFKLAAKVVPVDGYEAGVQRVLDRKADVFFGDRAILLDAAARSPSAGDLLVLDRLFTYEPLALALRAGRRGLPAARGPDAEPALRLGPDPARCTRSGSASPTQNALDVLPVERAAGVSVSRPVEIEVHMIQRSVKRLSMRALVVDDELTSPTAEGRAARALVEELQARDVEVVEASVAPRTACR